MRSGAVLPAPAARAFARRFAGTVGTGEPLARHTTLGIGGAADLFAVPEDEAQAVALLSAAREAGIRHVALGGGSNVLFADAGFRGLVLSTARLASVAVDAPSCTVVAGAGARLLAVLAACRAAGLAGFELADGIPGTVGGALSTNAGTRLGEISDVLRSVRVFTVTGVVETWEPARLGLGYRTSRLPETGAVALSATMLLPGPGAAAGRARADFAAYRQATQPAGMRNAGSIFKNPPADSAGRLIEAAGLSGAREGGAEISARHANFIVNVAEARATDVLRLMRRARAAVSDRFGVTLEPEIFVVGPEGPQDL